MVSKFLPTLEAQDDLLRAQGWGDFLGPNEQRVRMAAREVREAVGPHSMTPLMSKPIVVRVARERKKKALATAGFWGATLRMETGGVTTWHVDGEPEGYVIAVDYNTFEPPRPEWRSSIRHELVHCYEWEIRGYTREPQTDEHTRRRMDALGASY